MTTSDAGAPLRGVVVGTLSALVTGAAHDMGGAMMPSDAAIALLVLACAGAGWLSAALPMRRWALARVMVTLAAAQLLGHVLLTVVDGHHHGALMDARMATAHAAAVVVGGCLVHAAELGATAAVSALRRVRPLVDAGLVVDSDGATTVRREERELTPRLVDLSGCGTRGPPALL